MKMKIGEHQTTVKRGNMARVKGLRIIRKNVPRRIRADFYHTLLTMSWTRTLVLFFSIFLFLNALFATLYWSIPGALQNSTGSWSESFFFSVQTLGTIGYGYWSPVGTLAHLLVTLEAAMGLVFIAIMTGFFFAKFARAEAKIEFTDKLLLHEFDGTPALSFRIVNIRENQLVDSTVHLNLLLDTVTKEGQELRRFVDLKLLRSQVPVFSMSMSLIHLIDDSSPLKPLLSGERIKGEIFVTVVGTDGTFGQTLHATAIYQIEDIVRGGQWADMVTRLPDGARVIDYGKFDSFGS